MEDDRTLPPDQRQEPQPRRFVYRSAEPDHTHSHPLRRSTDTPHAFQRLPDQASSRTQLLKFRVYLKLN